MIWTWVLLVESPKLYPWATALYSTLNRKCIHHEIQIMANALNFEDVQDIGKFKEMYWSMSMIITDSMSYWNDKWINYWGTTDQGLRSVCGHQMPFRNVSVLFTPCWPCLSADSHKTMGSWDERMNGWMDGWINELINEWLNEWINQWWNHWMKQWMNEAMNEWMNQLINPSINESINQWIHVFLLTVTKP